MSKLKMRILKVLFFTYTNYTIHRPTIAYERGFIERDAMSIFYIALVYLFFVHLTIQRDRRKEKGKIIFELSVENHPVCMGACNMRPISTGIRSTIFFMPLLALLKLDAWDSNRGHSCGFFCQRITKIKVIMAG